MIYNKNTISVIRTAPLFCFFIWLFCSIERDNPFDVRGDYYTPPKITIDTSGTFIADGDTTHFSTVAIKVTGNRDECRFQSRIDSETWTEYQASGRFDYSQLKDGMHTIHLHTIFQSGIDTVTDSIRFFVVTAGYTPRFQSNSDTSIIIDSGKSITIISPAESMFPITYRWIKDSFQLENQKSDTITLSGINKSNEGIYRCIAENEWGSDTSRSFILTTRIPIPVYKVIYVDTKHISGTVPTDNTEYIKGDKVIVRGNTGNLQRSPFVFTGWDTAPDESDFTYSPGAEFNIDTNDVLLYARWTQNPTYKIMYNGNGNTTGNPPVDSNVYEKGSFFTIKNISNNMTKNNFVFTGWNSSSDGTGTSYTAGFDYNIGASDIILYAKWTNDSVYRVFYDGNGNESGFVPSDENRYEKGSTVVIRGNTGNLARNQYNLKGWNTAPDGSGISYKIGSECTIGTNNITLYAEWTQSRTFTITYQGNGNTNGSVPKDFNLYEKGDNAKIKKNSGFLEKTGHTFTGWSTLINGLNVMYEPEDSITIDTSNVFLKANWTIDTFTVTFNSNGGSALAPVQICYMTSLPDTVIPLREGYLFTGWYTDSTLSGDPFEISSPITESFQLYAKWIRAFSIRYNGNGGTGIVPVDNKIYLNNQTAFILKCDSLKKLGHEFMGWNTSGDASGKYFFPDSLIIIDTTDITLYAIWRISSPNLKNVKFISKDTTFSIEYLSDTLVSHDTTLIKPAIGPHPVIRFTFDKPIGDLIVYNQADSFYSVTATGPGPLNTPYYDCTINEPLLLNGNKLTIRVSSEGNLVKKLYTISFNTPLWGSTTFISVAESSLQIPQSLEIRFNIEAQMAAEDRTEGFLVFRAESDTLLETLPKDTNYSIGNMVGAWVVVGIESAGDTPDIYVYDTTVEAGKMYYYRVIPFARTNNGFSYFNNIAVGTNRSMETHPITLQELKIRKGGVQLDSIRANQFVRDTAYFSAILPGQLSISADLDSMPSSCSVQFSPTDSHHPLTFEKTYYDTNKISGTITPHHRFSYTTTPLDKIPLGNVVITITANIDISREQKWFMKGISIIDNAISVPVAFNQSPEMTLKGTGQWEMINMNISGIQNQATTDPRTVGVVIFRSAVNTDSLDLSDHTDSINPANKYCNTWVVDTIINNLSVVSTSYISSKLKSGTTYYYRAVPYGYNPENSLYSYASPTEAGSASTWKIVVCVKYLSMYTNDDGDGAGCAEFWQRLWVDKYSFGKSASESIRFFEQHDGMGAWCSGGSNQLNWSASNTMDLDDSLNCYVKVLEDDGDAWDEYYDDILFNEVLYSTRIRTLIGNSTASAMGKGSGFENGNRVVSGTLLPDVPTAVNPTRIDYNESRAAGDGPTRITSYFQLSWWFEK